MTRGYWADLADELAASGTEVVDLSAACLAAGMLDDPVAWAPGTRYSPKGNAIIAAALGQVLEQ